MAVGRDAIAVVSYVCVVIGLVGCILVIADHEVLGKGRACGPRGVFGDELGPFPLVGTVVGGVSWLVGNSTTRVHGWGAWAGLGIITIILGSDIMVWISL